MALELNKQAAFKVVNTSNELKRIVAMPRRVLGAADVTDKWNALTRLPGGTMSLWPIQATTLEEAYLKDGLFGALQVGAGKTLISLLLPLAMRSKRTVLLVPPKLHAKTLREAKEYAKHFNIDMDIITVVKYSALSSQKGLDLLADANPDLIIADEAHYLKAANSARGGRFNKYMVANPQCRFVGLSGTMMSRSVMDFAHLSEYALRKNSFVPQHYNERMLWAGALDAKPREFVRPGALTQLCEPGESPRAGFQRRMIATKGVITTTDTAVGMPLYLTRIDAPFDAAQTAAIETLQTTWEIGTEILEDPMRVAAFWSQLASGFYYEWDWPGEPDEEWNVARLQWAKEVRGFLKTTRDPRLDTKGLVENAVRAGLQMEHWDSWVEQKDKPEPPTKPVVISDYIIKAATEWAYAHTDGIIWYKHRATGIALAKACFDVYTPNRDPTGVSGVIVASVKAHGVGKNLQHEQKNNLILNIAPSADIIEQLAGRTHRPGQSHPVHLDYLGNPYNDQALEKAMLLAKSVHETTGQPQKIIYAERKM